MTYKLFESITHLEAELQIAFIIYRQSRGTMHEDSCCGTPSQLRGWRHTQDL